MILKEFIQNAEHIFILKTLYDNQWNVTQTAKVLNMSRTNIYRKFNSLNVKLTPDLKCSISQKRADLNITQTAKVLNMSRTSVYRKFNLLKAKLTSGLKCSISQKRFDELLKNVGCLGDKIYIPYHPKRNMEERKVLMNCFLDNNWEYADAWRTWDKQFNCYRYFWILRRV